MSSCIPSEPQKNSTGSKQSQICLQVLDFLLFGVNIDYQIQQNILKLESWLQNLPIIKQACQISLHLVVNELKASVVYNWDTTPQTQLAQIVLLQQEYQNRFNKMQNNSPSHRFQRTRSPKVGRNYESPKTSKVGQLNREMYYARSEEVSPQITQSLEEAEGKINNLSQLLKDQKQKRQTQFGQLYRMIHSIKKDRNRNEQPQFSYDEHEFPMTPRAGNKDSRRSRENSYATYTPIIETVSKQKNKFVDRHNYFPISMQEFPLRSIEMLMQNVQRDAEFNNRNITRIQDQILSLRLAMSRSREKTLKGAEIPEQFQKYVKDGIASMKKNVEIDRKSLYKDIEDIVQLKLEQKIKSSFSNFKDRSFNTQLSQIREKIDSVNICLGKQLKTMEQKLDNKIFVVNDIFQSKFTFFKQSLVDQVLKDRKKDLTDVESSISSQRKRIDQLEDANQQFYQELEKTMQNLQQKLKHIKNPDIQLEKWKQEWQQFVSSAEQSKQDLLADLEQKLNSQAKMRETEIRELQLRLERLEDLRASSSIKLVKNSSINSEKTMTPQVNQIGPTANQESNSFSESEQNQIGQADQNRQLNQLFVLFSQNCSFLEGRNCSIEESIQEIILVINDLVAQIRSLM